MRAPALSRRAGAILVTIACLTMVAITSTGRTPAQAQIPTDFDLSVSSTTLPPSGGTAELVVSVDPGESAVAALGATVTVNSDTVSVLECVALVGLGACGEPALGVVNLQTVDAGGWAEPVDLFRITYDVSALDAATAVEIELLEAFDVSGVLIAGTLTDGTIDVRVNGDVDCDGIRTIGDALIIAQYVVGTRTAASCPLPDPRTQIDLSVADVSGDESLDIGDALLVARCTVGLFDCDA